jgi:large subunit ribosomal protein L29
MKTKEIRDMGAEELEKKSRELAGELFRFRIRHSSGQLESPASLVRTRKDIARIKTVLKEREAR